jgi:hypothetical protein
MRRAGSQRIADLPIGTHCWLRHHRGNREAVVPIFIGRGAPFCTPTGPDLFGFFGVWFRWRKQSSAVNPRE